MVGMWGLGAEAQDAGSRPIFTLCLSVLRKLYPGNKCYQLKSLFYIIICMFLISNTCTRRERRVSDFVFIALCVPFMPLSSPALLAPQEILERGQPL